MRLAFERKHARWFFFSVKWKQEETEQGTLFLCFVVKKKEEESERKIA
jgi:hypothetical protein